METKNVHGLWIGDELSPMELLTISSFISNGYNFFLWIYKPLKNELPKGCVCSDANQILPKESIFTYKYTSQFGKGVGSYAGFSDIFRYKLLYEKGGWWVDMDVTCLKPFNITTPYFFRNHHSLPLVGNIMKAPIGSELMKKCYEDSILEIDENNRDWHKPIKILIKNVFEFKLEHYIVTDICNKDRWDLIKNFIYKQKKIPTNWFFIHWCNENWRTKNISKQNPIYYSNYGQLLLDYNLIPNLDLKEKKEHDRKLKIKLFLDKIKKYTKAFQCKDNFLSLFK